MPHSNITTVTRGRAKALRTKRTKAEQAMWNLLRSYRSRGARFRRETPIGPYIADFAWLSARIVIEVDGDTHLSVEGLAHDAVRDNFLRTQGFRVIRFSNPEIIEGPDRVVAKLEAELQGLIADDRP